MQCLYYFVPAVIKALQSIYRVVIEHRNTRIPNICIDENYCPVLIDFGFADKRTADVMKIHNLTTFIHDVTGCLSARKFLGN